MEVEAVELLCAGDVLDGLVGEAAGDEGLVGVVLRGSEFAGRVGGRSWALVMPRWWRRREFCVAAGMVAEVGIFGLAGVVARVRACRSVVAVSGCWSCCCMAPPSPSVLRKIFKRYDLGPDLGGGRG